MVLLDIYILNVFIAFFIASNSFNTYNNSLLLRSYNRCGALNTASQSDASIPNISLSQFFER